MGLLNSSLSNLLGGVSQQADSLRGASNCEEQTNAYPSPVNGLVKRPPTQFMTDALGANFQDANALDTASHLINRDSSERYLLTVSGKTLADGTGGGLSVWDLENNVAKTVYYDEDAIGYLNATDSTTAFSFATAGDVTYIANKEVTPRMTNELTEKTQPTGFIHVRQGAHDTTYYVSINGEEFSHSVATTGANVTKTTSIATAIVTALQASFVSDSAIISLGSSGDLGASNARFTITVPEGSNGGFGEVGQVVEWTSHIPWDTFAYCTNPNGYTGQTNFVQGDKFYISQVDAPSGNNRIYLKTLSGTLMYHSHNNYRDGSGTETLTCETHANTNLTDYSFNVEHSTILVTDSGDGNFILEARDTVGDTYLKAFKEETQYFSDLPASCANGMKLRIIGSAESDLDDYYVEFKTLLNTAYGEGSWNETVGYEQEHKYDYSTMPHILIRQADGSFLFKPADGINVPPNVTSGYTGDYDYFSNDNVDDHVTISTYSGTSLAILDAEPDTLIPTGTVVGIFTTLNEWKRYVTSTDVVASSTGTATLVLTETKTDTPAGVGQPVKLYYPSSEGKYTPFKWEDRKSGDDITNPLPNFIGNTISDIFFYENRLGVLSGESVTLSESGQFFNFFRTTVIDLLDTAPIEVVGSSNSVNTLRHGVSFNGNLLLFGDNTQFMLGSGREGLSPKTVAMSQVSNYECDPNCAPVIGGTSVFFAYPRGTYGGLQDMVIRDPEARDLQAFDLTDSVPSYIENPFRAVATMPQENLVIGLPKAEGGDMQDLYLYKYLDRGNERIQSAWFKFSLTSQGITADTQQIIGIHTVENVLYVLSRFVDSGTAGNSHTAIHKIEFTTEGITDLFSQPPLLDNVLSRLGNNDGLIQDGGALVGGDTVFTLPYGSEGKSASDFQIITKHKTGNDGGVVIPILSGTFLAESTTLTVDGDKRAEHVWIGSKYDMTYKYASPIFKGPSSGGGASLVTSGRYQIHSADIVYHDTNTFNVAVSVEGRSDYSYTFTADTTQVDVTSEGSVGLDSGDMRIPIHAKNDTYSMTITSDSAYPVKLLSTEFEAQYNARSRRMGI